MRDMMNNKPPYTITEKSASYLAKIVETVTQLEFGTDFKHDIKLHRENRMRTIYSSLAIEGNSLTLGEVTAIIEGKMVAGQQLEIKEVKNAYEAYDKIMKFDPYAINDFLKAHKLMTQGLVVESGKFRSRDVGVFDGGVAIHLGARPEFVPQLMADLLDWAKKSDVHPVLKSAILHYEIETIHPFADGNGRMGRLWQTLLLAKWNAIFAWIPMESVLYKNRPQYYKAIENSRKSNDSGAFIEFTLSAILDIITHQGKRKDERQDKRQVEHQDKRQVEHQDGHQVEHQVEHQDRHQVEHQVDLNNNEIAVLNALNGTILSRKEIFAAIGMSGNSRSWNRNIKPLLTKGFIKMTVPDKPNSKLQKYRLTKKGVAAINSHIGEVVL
jgi:Fic family protein